MCAISGIIDYQRGSGDQKEICQRMLETMQRRGPDQEGIYCHGPAALIHARLCVVDIENGRQPYILSKEAEPLAGEETYALVYNGELYNTDELRVTLKKQGHRFSGHSDTEVLLHAYLEWKEACVEKLNGIFAFAVWEERAQRLFIARDRIGVKPFFYSKTEGTFVFASEIKTLLAHPLIHPRVNQRSLLEIMLIGPGRTPGCGVFCGIDELEPACCGVYTEEGLKTWRYWRLEDQENTDSFEETVEKVRYLVQDAIERQLVSDVPVCTFLSGGLDSSIISAVADRHFTARGEKLHTFSVSYRDNQRYFKAGKFQPDSDDAYIGIMNSVLHAEHHNVILDSEDVAQALCEAVEARDLPGMADVDSSLLLFCREVKQYATVALSGECADEIFGGYPWYRDQAIRERDGFPWAQSTLYRASFLRPEVMEGADPFAYVDEKYRATVAETSVLPTRDREEKRMKEMVNLNFRWFMQTLLDRKDRMSMYSGLEVRVPFCDYRIAQYLYTVPWAYKDYQGREKGLLRCAVQGLLPQEILQRKKSPYPKTHHPAYLIAVSRMLKEVISGGPAPILQILRREAIEALLDDTDGRDAQIPWYGQLMNRPQTIAYLLQVNHWLAHYKIELV